MNVPFLKQVAQAYLAHYRDLVHRSVFIFPNRRSGVFFSHIFRECAGDTVPFTPTVSTLNAVASQIIPFSEASFSEQILTLWNEYSELNGEISDFSRFFYWGKTLLDDFHEVDRSLIDPDHLFVNVQRYKEIQSNYLTDIQIEILKKYFGEVPSSASVDKFWKHTNHKGNKHASSFLKLWEILSPLYHSFHNSLEKNGTSTRAHQLRRLARLAKADFEAAFPQERYIFIGFDIPSIAEIEIFSELKKHGKADFYFDCPELLLTNGLHPLSRIFKNLKKDFPQLYDLENSSEEIVTEITVTGVPGVATQAKFTAGIIKDWITEKVIDTPENAINTAVVIPDEKLFIPLSHSIPAEISAVNITMGLPLSVSGIADLLNSIVKMQITHRDASGKRVYLYKDVERVLSFKLFEKIFSEDGEELINFIRKNRVYTVKPEIVAEKFPSLEQIFTNDYVESDYNSAFKYLDNILHIMETGIGDDEEFKLEKLFITEYRKELSALYRTVASNNLNLSGTMFMTLAERSMSSKSIPFEGEPVKGLQIMGVLETRALDFDNVIFTSMNEGIFPRKANTPSLIPDNIRRAYGLNSQTVSELKYAYCIYRLLGRSKKVHLLYNNATGSLQNAEMSRFISQLLYLFPSFKIKHNTAVFSTTSTNKEKTPLKLYKRGSIADGLERFKAGGDKYLSASALKTYLNCPLQFGLGYVCGYKVEDRINDYMESNTLGSIVHDVADKLYKSTLGNGGNGIVTERLLTEWSTPPYTNLDRLITISMNKEFNHTGISNDTTPLTGEARIFAKAIRHIIIAMLKAEKQFADFEYIGGEDKTRTVWDAGDGLNVNFTYLIDRIDRTSGSLRIVDYKTGNEEAKIPGDLSKMFNRPANESERKTHSIFQVLVYCHLYRLVENDDSAVAPWIYNLQRVAVDGLSPTFWDKSELYDYRLLDGNFIPLFNELLQEIFNPQVPFAQNPDEKACGFCNFKDLCSRD